MMYVHSVYGVSCVLAGHGDGLFTVLLMMTGMSFYGVLWSGYSAGVLNVLGLALQSFGNNFSSACVRELVDEFRDEFLRAF